MKNIYKILDVLESCYDEGPVPWIEALGDPSPEEVWKACQRGPDMIWACARLGLPPKPLVMLACDLVAPAVNFIPADDPKPAMAFSRVRDWALDRGSPVTYWEMDQLFCEMVSLEGNLFDTPPKGQPHIALAIGESIRALMALTEATALVLENGITEDVDVKVNTADGLSSALTHVALACNLMQQVGTSVMPPDAWKDARTLDDLCTEYRTPYPEERVGSMTVVDHCYASQMALQADTLRSAIPWETMAEKLPPILARVKHTYDVREEAGW